MSKVFEEIKEALEQALALERGYLPEYRGYVGTVAYSDEDKVFYGKVVGIRSLISYEGTDLKKLEEDFHDVVDEYLLDCVQDMENPETATPLSDSLVGVIKCTPEEILEREARNAWIDKVIKEVDGSMALSGMPLTDEDKERIKYCLEHPENFQNVLERLIRKHDNALQGQGEKDTDTGWINDEDGVAHCPSCRQAALEDEYTGKPILFKFCPECGEFLNGICKNSATQNETADMDGGLPIKINFVPKTQYCLSDSDTEVLKGYVLGAFKVLEAYHKELQFSEEQKAELLHALELSAEDMTTQEAYEYFKNNT